MRDRERLGSGFELAWVRSRTRVRDRVGWRQSGLGAEKG